MLSVAILLFCCRIKSLEMCVCVCVRVWVGRANVAATTGLNEVVYFAFGLPSAIRAWAVCAKRLKFQEMFPMVLMLRYDCFIYASASRAYSLRYLPEQKMCMLVHETYTHSPSFQQHSLVFAILSPCLLLRRCLLLFCWKWYLQKKQSWIGIINARVRYLIAKFDILFSGML